MTKHPFFFIVISVLSIYFDKNTYVTVGFEGKGALLELASVDETAELNPFDIQNDKQIIILAD